MGQGCLGRVNSAKRIQRLNSSNAEAINQVFSSPAATPVFQNATHYTAGMSPVANSFDMPVTSSVNSSFDHESGERLVNQYAVLNTLGQGSYGKVKRVRNIQTGKYFAAKITDRRELFRHAPAQGTALLANVYNEIDILHNLNHPGIPKVYEVIDDPSVAELYCVMSLVQGGPVVRQGDVIDPDEAKRMMRDISDVLMYLHDQKVVHGDIKPDNVMANDERYTLIDFGTSRSMIHSRECLRHTAGTQAFMAPEITLNHSYNGKHADIWALGVTLYDVLYGSLPFIGSDIAQITYRAQKCRPHFPAGEDALLLDLFSGLLAKNPAYRLTAAQIRRHPWVTGETDTSSLRPFHLDVQLGGRQTLIRASSMTIRRRSVLSLSPLSSQAATPTGQATEPQREPARLKKQVTGHLSTNNLGAQLHIDSPRSRRVSWDAMAGAHSGATGSSHTRGTHTQSTGLTVVTHTDTTISESAVDIDTAQTVTQDEGEPAFRLLGESAVNLFGPDMGIPCTMVNEDGPLPADSPRKPSIVQSIQRYIDRWDVKTLDDRVAPLPPKLDNIVWNNENEATSTLPLTARSPSTRNGVMPTLQPLKGSMQRGIPAHTTELDDESTFDSDTETKSIFSEGDFLSDVRSLTDAATTRSGESVTPQDWSEIDSFDAEDWIPPIFDLLVDVGQQVEVQLTEWNVAVKPPYCRPVSIGSRPIGR
ncbi:Protein kinase domain [Carpediemonas membranifera]|uniref:Protein kinase domain n=1 Tax=Carpediemonas membranifera TaxID=201153 RepID=A0A8J6E7B1_9EUKA|nr:Protein kinase domain [Carpediemonas membranifera]|eukprot:KAG9390520.1 Protein kinase domain [Carpediemonas membranifera]